jgi:hypothetical protein
VSVALFARRKPAFRLTGLVASPDGLYDGSFIAACAHWWNSEVETRREMKAAGHRAFSSDEARRLLAVVQSENRPMLEAVASGVSIPGRQSTAVLSLAYAVALVVEAGVGQARDAEQAAATWVQPRPFTEGDLTELQRHYNEEGAAREYELWAPYWIAAATVFGERIGPKLIVSARSVFDDQVERWGVAEGMDLRRSVGAPDYSLLSFDENAGLPDFVQLLFEWGGRLRLGERFLADGVDLADERFGYDEFDPIDHFYDEAYERYVEIASQPNPVGEDIELAVRCGAAWLGEGKSDGEQLAISTAAIRGYLWRTVENGAIGFLEPELSEAVERSLAVGDDRALDEPFGLTLYYAASQCMADGVKTRLGSLGGLIQGPKSYEKAFYATTGSFDEQGLDLDEEAKRHAFQFGVSLADSERVLTRSAGDD